jgi:hypothetical protein
LQNVRKYVTDFAAAIPGDAGLYGRNIIRRDYDPQTLQKANFREMTDRLKYGESDNVLRGQEYRMSQRAVTHALGTMMEY